MQGNVRLNLFIITSAISEVLTFARTVVSVHRTIVLKHNILIQETVFLQHTQVKNGTITEPDTHALVRHTIDYLKSTMCLHHINLQFLLSSVK